MLRSALKSVLRATRRHLGYTAINVIGLAVGIAVCALITLYVRHELSYDDFHEDADRIYRVVSDWGDQAMPGTTWPAIREIKRQNPSLTVAPFFETPAVVNRETSRFYGEIFLARPTFFEIFSFPVRSGTAQQALSHPYTAVITPSMAEKYFGEQSPIGQTLELNGLYGTTEIVTVTVRGVLEPIPDASHFHPQILVSWATMNAAFNFEEEFADDWGNNGFRAYLNVPANASPATLAADFTRQGKARAGERWNGATLKLQPLTDIHLHSNLNNELEANGSAATVSLFGVVALFILALACINFVNLATARATERAKEVGVRKTVGAGRTQLIAQFLTESALLSGVALVLSIGVIAAGLPVFRSLTGMDISLAVLTEPFALAALLGITVLAAVGAGSYPAFVLSRFDPVRVLSGSSRGSTQQGSATLRKGLVVLQFSIAVILIAGTVTAYWQLDYLQQADLGFDQEQILTIPIPPAADSTALSRAFVNEVQEDAEVQSVARASERLPSELLSGNSFGLAGLGLSRDDYRGLRVVSAGPRFFQTLGVDLLAGRSFEVGRPADSAAAVLNRAAYELLAKDLPADKRSLQSAVGRPLRAHGGWPVERPRLVGVVENFHLSSLHERIQPVIFLQEASMINTYYLRVDARQASQVLSDIESVWNQFYPDAPFNHAFADQAFAHAYRAEQRLGTLFGVFAGLAIFIACLGLLGLAAFAVRQRHQEIGVRKAVGASTTQIMSRFSKDFGALVIGAIVVAVPVAYAALNWWLNTFAYRIDLGAGVFLLAGGGVLLVALLAVSTQVLRIARVDPAATLRDE